MDIAFVLVEPARGENIGAAARALKTMGFEDLRLVRPGDMTAASWVAHQSQDILANARQFNSLDEALADVDLSIACTARQRIQKERYVNADECAALLSAKHTSVQRAAIVFGRESSGLNGEEVARCDLGSSIPLAHPQPSLNLAQAVMVYAWELRKHRPEAPAAANDQDTYRHTRDALQELLNARGIEERENLHQWLLELLPLADDRALGLIRQLMRRLTKP
ncbi:tRNA/rRNA methyltransferase [Alcanivorax sp. S6407]|uniref:tRNA/rRNA methyltransferase n=1 Tax=Alcanivorax sp. S6407 TaxID=2926424 RepID=UPI001FF18EDB|nr:tRNA/rRNA methyltransferase [Alcanivorax sp. S6407]MCK0152921.1 tRNA/rRNA methyltransferase [Alcanivorax sp. S6407]